MTGEESEPGGMQARSKILKLREIYRDCLHVEQVRSASELAARQIAGIFRNCELLPDRDLPITQDSMTGFLNGFTLTCARDRKSVV